jgi:hypothetical protein
MVVEPRGLCGCRYADGGQLERWGRRKQRERAVGLGDGRKWYFKVTRWPAAKVLGSAHGPLSWRGAGRDLGPLT